MYGRNPKNHESPWREGIIEEEVKRVKFANRYQNTQSDKVLIKRAVPITKERYDALRNYINQEKEKPSKYKAHFNDCISFTNKMLAVIGMQDARITNIIKPEEIKLLSLAKISASMRSIDDKIVLSFSKEKVASQYNISIERVKEMDIDHLYNCRV